MDYSDQIALGSFLADSKESTDLSKEPNMVPDDLITGSPEMLECLRIIKLAANIDATVLLSGETGVGKSKMANILHNYSNRTDKPFIEINCGSIPPTFMESELFGYEPGSFTGAKDKGKIGLIEAANGGTVFLDEISEMGLTEQVKLLEVIQHKQLTRIGSTKKIKVDVRFVAASNRDLKELVTDGKFRSDLYYRLNVLPIEIPPLRKRKNDIALLADYFINKNNEKYNVRKKLTPSAKNDLANYSWPGNVRELEHVIERVHIISHNKFIDSHDLPPEILGDNINSSGVNMVTVNKLGRLQDVVEQAEKELLILAMSKYKTSREIAEALGTNPSTISRRIERYGLKEK